MTATIGARLRRRTLVGASTLTLLASTALVATGVQATEAQNTAAPNTPPDVLTFADEDRSADLADEPVHQRYQFSSPTTVTYDRDTVAGPAADARVYVADVGNHVVRVLDLEGRQVGVLDDHSATLAPDSPESTVPTITAPLGISFLSASEVDDDRLAGLYVNDVGTHEIHFFRTVAADADAFEYVTSFGRPGHGGGEELTLPRNVTVLPQGLVYVSDEFNHRVKGFRLDPETWSATLLTTDGRQDQNGRYIDAGPILPGVDKDFGADSAHYDDYAGDPEKVDGYRIPQGQTFWRSDTGRTFLYVADNGNNRIKIFEVDDTTGTLTLVDMIGRYVHDGEAGHLKRPRGIRADRDGNIFVADTYGGQVLRLDNLDSSGGVAYRSGPTADVEATWAYGHLGIHQIEMRLPATALNEDEAMQLPNDAVPLVRPDGTRRTEGVWAWGAFYSDAPVVLVSDTGNHRVKKCWEHPDEGSVLRCSVSAGVGGAGEHEFWGHPRTLPGQLHYTSALEHLPAADGGEGTILASDTPNSVIESYSTDGTYEGSFTGGQLAWGVTGLATFRGVPGTEDRRVAALVAADTTLPWPYTGDSALRLYEADGDLDEIYNLTYRTAGFDAPTISFTGDNLPIAVEVDTGRADFAVYVTTSEGYLWRFSYDPSAGGQLTADWVVGGQDPAKGVDGTGEWDYGPGFFDEGAPGTFDQIQDVTAGDGRVYAVDRRNQRIQVFAAADGTLLGQIGAGGGTYDHADTITADDFFLPHGVDLDSATDTFLVGDGFNFVARRYADPSGLAPDSDGRIRPEFEGHWLDTTLGTRDGGLFATQHVLRVGEHVFVDSLISNRITRFDADSFTPAS